MRNIILALLVASFANAYKQPESLNDPVEAKYKACVKHGAFGRADMIADNIEEDVNHAIAIEYPPALRFGITERDLIDVLNNYLKTNEIFECLIKSVDQFDLLVELEKRINMRVEEREEKQPQVAPKTNEKIYTFSSRDKMVSWLKRNGTMTVKHHVKLGDVIIEFPCTINDVKEVGNPNWIEATAEPIGIKGLAYIECREGDIIYIDNIPAMTNASARLIGQFTMGIGILNGYSPEFDYITVRLTPVVGRMQDTIQR